MFERFTDRSRRALTLAQEEARLLNHGFIGTEHLLLGLVAEGNGLAAKTMEQLGVTLDRARQRVEEIIGRAESRPVGSPPFTPRTKKVLELALREALQLGHNYIGTEHLLLGVVREGNGVAVQVLESLGVDLATVRQTVVTLLGQATGSTESSVSGGSLPVGEATFVRCSFCGRQPPESGRVVRGSRAYICEHCVSEWHRKLLAPGEEPEDMPEATLYEPGENQDQENEPG